MKRFRCGHCGGRLVVHPRHLGRLVTCPECGRSTHPLAEEILAGERTDKDVRITAVSSPSSHRTCGNCGQTIGTLQKLNVWRNHLVCTPCFEALAHEKGGVAALVIPDRHTDDPLSAKSEMIDAQSSSAPPLKVTATPLARRPEVGLPGAIFDTSLRVLPLAARGRLLILLGVVCIGGAAVYGALSLLRDLAGIVTALAFILLALIAILVTLRASVVAGKKWLGLRRDGTATAKIEDVDHQK